MTLKNDIEQEKKELERQLLSEIKRFEKRTGLDVRSVNFYSKSQIEQDIEEVNRTFTFFPPRAGKSIYEHCLSVEINP